MDVVGHVMKRSPVFDEKSYLFRYFGKDLVNEIFLFERVSAGNVEIGRQAFSALFSLLCFWRNGEYTESHNSACETS